jgi:NAD(P)H-dependent FMN reductase
MPTILGLCGSLRAQSSNLALLRAAEGQLPPGSSLTLFNGLASLPAFNPDQESAGAHALVRDWQAALRACDALLISTPEYAHGIPGALKNALDWVVGSGELVGKPVGVLTLAYGGPKPNFVQAQLVEVLRAMDARVPDAAVVNFSGSKQRLQPDGRGLDAAERAVLGELLAALGA